jgi:putative drug exporter of the RND superfamily
VPAAMALVGNSAWWLPAWLSRILPNVDIEGERLKHHLAGREWAQSQDSAIAAEGLVAGFAGTSVGPVDFTVSQGGILFVSGEPAQRNLLAATLGGRLDPLSGRLQVTGLSLPSEKSRVLGLVALVGGAHLGAPGDDKTVGEALAERMELALPWFKTAPSKKQVKALVERMNEALVKGSTAAPSTPTAPITAETRLGSLSSLERAACVAAAALSEKPRVVVMDAADGLPVGTDEAGGLGRFALVVSALATTDTTIVISCPAASNEAIPEQSRETRAVTRCHLSSTEREGVLL